MDSKATSLSDIRLPMVLKMERICKGYIDHLEKGGEEINFQNFIIMYIFGACNNTEYRTKLFDHWPTYLEDWSKCKTIMGYRYPETIRDEVLSLGLSPNVRIIDIACGAGNVAHLLKDNRFTNIDGLDPSKGLLDAAQEKKLYQNVICSYVMPTEQTPIADETYDVLTCSAGMFPGSIVPQAFTELLRMVKPGGYLIWNIADGYEGFNDFFKDYDFIMNKLTQEKKWQPVQPVKKLDNMLFEDSGYVYVMKKLTSY